MGKCVRVYGLVLALLVCATVLAGCGQPSASDIAQSQSDALQKQVYQSKHNVEFRNYNLRQKIADDPSTILWCTFFPPTVGQEPITVPIAGKLTSSFKRPYASTDGNGEVPGPDHMFGASSEYRYGFDPTLTQYSDFTLLASYCTTVPTVWQANKTTIVSDTSATLNSVSQAAQQAIKDGHAEKALALLKTTDSVKKKGK